MKYAIIAVAAVLAFVVFHNVRATPYSEMNKPISMGFFDKDCTADVKARWVDWEKRYDDLGRAYSFSHGSGEWLTLKDHIERTNKWGDCSTYNSIVRYISYIVRHAE